MSPGVQDLIESVEAAGATLRVVGDNLVIRPAANVPRELKAELRKHKSEIIRQLEMLASLERLEASSILIGICDSGDIRIVCSELETHKATLDGFTIYSPKDCLMYVSLSVAERKMLHDFKKRFGRSGWKRSS